MHSDNTDHHKMTTFLFIIYLILLTWIVVFKMQFSVEALMQFTSFRSVNLVPFQGTAVYDGILDFREVLFNVLAFVPFGIYISMLKQNWVFLKKLAPIAVVSLTFEISQFIFSIGSSDVTDFLGNTFGGVIGIGIYFLFRRLFKGKATQALNLLAFLATIAVLIFGLLLRFGVIQMEYLT
ncbi:MAG TPA: VanZ family protein [Atopostipes sp.]|nr:VanZ family protein [Atopostipes sp.]